MVSFFFFFCGNGDLFLFGNEMEKWNWNWDKVNFPKTSATCDTHTHPHTLGVPVVVQTAFPFSPSIISSWRCKSVCGVYTCVCVCVYPGFDS